MPGLSVIEQTYSANFLLAGEIEVRGCTYGGSRLIANHGVLGLLNNCYHLVICRSSSMFDGLGKSSIINLI